MIRLILIVLMAFVALTIPVFFQVMNLLGASTLTITSLVFPPIFYLYLSAAEKHKKHVVMTITKRRVGNERQIIENAEKEYSPLIFKVGFLK